MRTLHVVVATLILMSASQVNAAAVIFTDLDIFNSQPNFGISRFGRSNFLAAVGAVQEERFNSPFVGTTTTINFPNFIMNTNKDFSYIAGGSFEGGGAILKSGIFTSDPLDAVTFTFAQPIRAFGINIHDFGDGSGLDQFYFSVNGTDYLGADLNNGNITSFFFGIVDPNLFTTISFKNTAFSDSISYDFVQYAVPEPSNFLCIVSFAALVSLWSFQKAIRSSSSHSRAGNLT